MPKQKKEAANWNIAATHYLTAGFAIPIFGSLVFGILLMAIGSMSPLILALIGYVVGLVLVVLGVAYSARYVNNAYVIANPSSIVNLSTTYYAVITLGFAIIVTIYMSISHPSQDSMALISDGISLVLKIVYVVVFYFASKNMIQASQQVSTPTPSMPPVVPTTPPASTV